MRLMPAERTFVDTNILLYAYDVNAGKKRELATDAVKTLWRSGGVVVSTQVLQEFYVNATRKLAVPLSRSKAEGVLRRYHQAWEVEQVRVADVLSAVALEQSHQLSFWDALIVATAARAGATRLLTEDLNAGQTIEGVRVLNPLE